MIRYSTTKTKLRTEISSLDVNWFTSAASVLAGLSARPASSEFKPLYV